MARFAVTAAFVGGFWLVGQSTAQAEDGTSETLSSVTSAITSHTDLGTHVDDGDGDGGDASTTQSADIGDNIAIGTGNNVTVGDVCVISTCESTQTVNNDTDNATTDVEQEAVTIGGDGGDGGDGSTTQSSGSGNNIAIGTGNNVTVGDVCVISTCESTQTVNNDSDNATTDVEQEAVTVGGDGGDGGDGTSPRQAEDNKTPDSGHDGDEAEAKDERTRDGAKSPGSGTDRKADANGGDGGDAATSQSAEAGDNIAIGAGNNLTSGSACLVSRCESTQNVANDSDNATTDVDQEAVTIGGGGGSGGGATSPTTAGAGVLDIASPATTGFGGGLGGFAALAGIMLVLLFVIATGASRSNPARG